MYYVIYMYLTVQEVDKLQMWIKAYRSKIHTINTFYFAYFAIFRYVLHITEYYSFS